MLVYCHPTGSKKNHLDTVNVGNNSEMGKSQPTQVSSLKLSD